jgi:protein CpxP
MKHLSVISVSVLAILLLSTSAMAWSNCKTKRCNVNVDCSQAQQGNRLERMAVILDLSPEQQQQMTELRTAQKEKRAQMRTQLREARQQLRTAQAQAGVETADLKAKARTFSDLKGAMLLNKIEHKQQMFSILTPEQQEKAAKLKGMHAERGNKGQCAECCPKNCNQTKGCNMQNKCADTRCRS